MKDTKNSIIFSGILGLSFIISALIGGYAIYKIRSGQDGLSVTGSAVAHVTSDQAKWTPSFSRVVKASELKYGYATMASDLVIVKKFFADNGLTDQDYSVSQVFMNENYDYNNSNGVEREKEYTLMQNISLTSNDVTKITQLAKSTGALISQGVLFNATPVEYYYSKLADLRVSLLSDAIKDARARADRIASSDDQQVGSLRSASGGVVQVLSANSVDISDYGSYDTSSIEKSVMITVKAAFSFK
jgi:uncharacterized protein